MRHMRIGLRGGLAALLIGLSTAAWASPYHRHHAGPPVFNRDGASAVGRARQHYDRELYHQYRGNPGAQFELRQKRQNLCRNVPEMC